MASRTYPIDPTLKWSILNKTTGDIVPNQPWGRADGQPFVGDTFPIVYLQQLPDEIIPFDPNADRQIDLPPEIIEDDDVTPAATGTIQRKFATEPLSQNEVNARAKQSRLTTLEKEVRKVAKKLTNQSNVTDAETLQALEYLLAREDFDEDA